MVIVRFSFGTDRDKTSEPNERCVIHVAPKSHLPFPNAQNMSGVKEEKRGEAGRLEIYLGVPR